MSIREVWTDLWKPKPRQNMTHMGGHISMQTIPNAMQGLEEAPEGIWEHCRQQTRGGGEVGVLP